MAATLRGKALLAEIGVLKDQGGDSQNFLGKFLRFFVTLDHKILRSLRPKVLFEANVIKG
jgi:hypothetical protein